MISLSSIGGDERERKLEIEVRNGRVVPRRRASLFGWLLRSRKLGFECLSPAFVGGA